MLVPLIMVNIYYCLGYLLHLLQRQDLFADAQLSLAMLPLLSISLVPIHSLPLTSADPALVLTPQVITDIYLNKIHYWDDPGARATHSWIES